MTATDSLPPSPPRAPGAVRESWQREPKTTAAAGDVVAIFADMVAEAAERLDDLPATATAAGHADDESAQRGPSPDEVVASMASLPGAAETRPAGRAGTGHGDAGNRAGAASEGAAAAAADATKQGRESQAAALATETSRAALEGKPDAARDGAGADLRPATEAPALSIREDNASSSRQESLRAGVAVQADGPREPPGTRARRALISADA